MAFNQKSLYNFNMRAFDIAGSVKCVQNYFLKHKLYTVIKRNAQLKERVKPSGKAYVCALGPSLKQVNLNKIKGDTIVVNRFFKIGKEFPEFVPTYYIMIDCGFASEEHKKDFHEALDTYLPKGTIFFLNSQLAGTSLLEGYDKTNIYFVSCFRGNVHANRKYRLDGILPAFQNVVGAAELVLMLLGYKEISLLGCDFNSFASRTRIHCYKDASEKRPSRMSQELFAYSLAAKGHDNLQEYALANNVKIINSTKESLIDAYPLEIEENLYN